MKQLTVTLLALCVIGIAHAQTVEQPEKEVSNPKFGSTVIYVEAE
jgi:hypothetical protein